MSGGRKYAHINSKGDVEPCVFCHFATHNVHESSLIEALNSPLFQAIKTKIPFDENLYRPCMLVDHPEVGREMALEHGAYFTHEGAEVIFTELAEEIDVIGRPVPVGVYLAHVVTEIAMHAGQISYLRGVIRGLEPTL